MEQSTTTRKKAQKRKAEVTAPQSHNNRPWKKIINGSEQSLEHIPESESDGNTNVEDKFNVWKNYEIPPSDHKVLKYKLNATAFDPAIPIFVDFSNTAARLMNFFKNNQGNDPYVALIMDIPVRRL
eukprot:TRINITY_DN11219_c0_g2_i1.p1 TRINITY_DN11219_c0_g2~~TRINITY_DN11219_c0_g2_i1.p1  ORF type:complete len:126 (-),score=15.80 TRINITY_DN11219_c0_g2_i1:7-384(-)